MRRYKMSRKRRVVDDSFDLASLDLRPASDPPAVSVRIQSTSSSSSSSSSTSTKSNKVPIKEEDDVSLLQENERALFVAFNEDEGPSHYFLDESQMNMSPVLKMLWTHNTMSRYGRLNEEQISIVDDYLVRVCDCTINGLSKGKAPDEGETTEEDFSRFVVVTEYGAEAILYWLSRGDASLMTQEKCADALKFLCIPYMENDYPVEVWQLQMTELYLRRRGRKETFCPKVDVKTALDGIDYGKTRNYEGHKLSKLAFEGFSPSEALEYARVKGVAPRMKVMGAVDLSEYDGKLVAAGGSVSAQFTGAKFDDRDFFFVGLGAGLPEGPDKDRTVLEQAKEIAVSVMNKLRDVGLCVCKAGLCGTCWSFVTKYKVRGDKTRHKFQFVLRNYANVDEILLGFDVDACAVAYDGTNFHVSKRAANAFCYKANFLDLTRASPTYEYRLFKYCMRGFDIAVPGCRDYDDSNQVRLARDFLKSNDRAIVRMNDEGVARVTSAMIANVPRARRRNGFIRYVQVVKYNYNGYTSMLKGYPLLWFLYVGYQRFLVGSYIWRPFSDYKKVIGRGAPMEPNPDGPLNNVVSFVGRQGAWISTSRINPQQALNNRALLEELLHRGGLGQAYLMSDDPSRQLTSSFRSLAIDEPEYWFYGSDAKQSKNDIDGVPVFCF